jgi:hypothetical protein
MNSPRSKFSIISEPTGETYRRLLAALADHAALVGLVIRPETRLSARGEAAVAEVLRLAVEDSEVSEWPGTQLLRGEARVIKLPASEEVVTLLTQLADSLYSWQHPNLLEDMFFLRSDGSTLLGTIAHEVDAFLELSPEEESAIVRRVPELSEMIRLG